VVTERAFNEEVAVSEQPSVLGLLAEAQAAMLRGMFEVNTAVLGAWLGAAGTTPAETAGENDSPSEAALRNG
jgi:hypothetical protein